MNKTNRKCPNAKCNCVADHELINEYDENTNINRLASVHLKCIKCGMHFNKWLASKERLKEVYGDQYHHYRN